MPSITQKEREQRFRNMPTGPLPWPKDYVLIDNYDANADDMDAICLARGVARWNSEYTDLAYRRFYKCTYRNCNYRILSYQNAERGVLYEKWQHNHGLSTDVSENSDIRNSTITRISDKQFDRIAAKSQYKLNLLDRYDDWRPMIMALKLRGISNPEKSCKTCRWCGVVRKYYHGGGFQVKFMSLQKNDRFVLYEVKGIKHYASVNDESVSDSVAKVDTDESRDVTPSIAEAAALGDTSVPNFENTTENGPFDVWLESIENDARNAHTDDSIDAAVYVVETRGIQEVTLAVNNHLLESYVPEKWKLMGRYNDFNTLNEVRKAKDVRCCRMEVKDGITEKYYRCYSCNYKMWSRERGDKCVLYYSGEHNHPFEQLDVKPTIHLTTDAVTSNIANPSIPPKVVPIIVNPADPDTHIINGALAIVKCAPFSCYSLSCLTQIAVEFGLQLILDDFNQGQFSLRKDNCLIKFIICEAAITINFREGADLEHSESRALTDWGHFLAIIHKKCTNFL